MLGVKTIGNATLIAFDEQPIIATDPWFGGDDTAYFGSWNLSHEIPPSIRAEILDARYIWFSHGHPDHLNPLSLERLRGKHILLPDHRGERIKTDLESQGFVVSVLKDREWMQLSPRIRVLCIATLIQDAILLVEVNGRLFVDLNDAGTPVGSGFIRQLASSYKHSYLLSLSGYGDADMINFYDERGQFVIPPAASNRDVGRQLTLIARNLGLRSVVPFSSFHRYARTDSIWADRYTTDIDAYSRGFDHSLELLPPFCWIDCVNGDHIAIKPCETQPAPRSPEDFGDRWSDELTQEDVTKIRRYFEEREAARNMLRFIRFRVGGRDHTIDLAGRKDKGITFEVPRHSLMTAIEYEIFDDLLIGNFMKTTLHNMRSLYEGDFAFYVAKYADNGRAKSEAELRKYFDDYRHRAGSEWLWATFAARSADLAKRLLPTRPDAGSFRLAKQIYYRFK